MWLCVHAPMYSTLPKKEKERMNDFFFLDQIQLKKALKPDFTVAATL